MANSKTRKILLVCCVAAVILLIAPAASQACGCFDWLWGCCGSRAAAPTYAPAYSVQYPLAAQTCNYVPQTSYRTVLRTVPTTVYRPVSYCDPCTGCARITYRPITSYVRSAQLVPYTTYRPVWTSSCYTPCATPCATTCGTTCGSSFGTTIYAGAASDCSSCVSTPATTLAPTPMPGATMTTPPANGTAPVIRQDVPPQSFQQNKPIKPVPDKEVQGSSLGGPQLNGPSLDRTTARPVRRATYQAAFGAVYQPVSSRAARNAPAFDYGGWRASNR